MTTTTDRLASQDNDLVFLLQCAETRERALHKTLRDQFAMAVLPACVSACKFEDEIADQAYKIANEMMKRREHE